MNISLDPTDKQDLEKLAESEGKDPGELLRELVHAAIGSVGTSRQEGPWERRRPAGILSAGKAPGSAGGPPAS